MFGTFGTLGTLGTAGSLPQATHPLIKDCKIVKEYGFVSETFKLYGDVKIITDPKKFATFDVKVNREAASLYVRLVEKSPVECGQWRFVDNEKDADFTIFIVEESEDFSICFVGEGENHGTAY
jgi:hypothetical protein